MVMDASSAANQLVIRRNRPGTSAKVSDKRGWKYNTCF